MKTISLDHRDNAAGECSQQSPTQWRINHVGSSALHRMYGKMNHYMGPSITACVMREVLPAKCQKLSKFSNDAHNCCNVESVCAYNEAGVATGEPVPTLAASGAGLSLPNNPSAPVADTPGEGNPIGGAAEEAKRGLTVLEVGRSVFGRILLTPDMIVDHLPDAYLKALKPSEAG